MKKEISKILLQIKAVALNAKEPFRYASGILSPIYCDNRLLMSYPDMRKQVVNAFIKTIEDLNLEFDIIGGTATAGIPHAAWISERLGKPMIYIRSSAKDHGKQNLIEGLLEKGKKVLVIEDLISTGGSSVSAVNAVREAGGIVTDCVAIFTYEMQKAIDKFAEAQCTIHTLSNFGTLIDVAEESGYLDSEAAKKVREWNKDPAGWGKAMGFE